MPMDTEILDIINRNLPQQVGDLLKGRLSRVSELEVLLGKTNNELEKVKVERDRLLAESNDWKGFREEKEKLAIATQKLEAAQRGLDKTLLEKELTTQKEHNKTVISLVEKVFANNRIKYKSDGYGPTHNSSGYSRNVDIEE